MVSELVDNIKDPIFSFVGEVIGQNTSVAWIFFFFYGMTVETNFINSYLLDLAERENFKFIPRKYTNSWKYWLINIY